MALSRIQNVVRQFDLKPGDTMKSIHGDDIANSRVLSETMIIHAEDSGFRLLHDHPITGEQMDFWMSAGELDQLRGYAA
jgi:hypothetical protein